MKVQEEVVMTTIKPSGKRPPLGVILGAVIALVGVLVGGLGATVLDFPMMWTAIAGLGLFVVGGGIFFRAVLRSSE